MAAAFIAFAAAPLQAQGATAAISGTVFGLFSPPSLGRQLDLPELANFANSPHGTSRP